MTLSVIKFVFYFKCQRTRDSSLALAASNRTKDGLAERQKLLLLAPDLKEFRCMLNCSRMKAEREVGFLPFERGHRGKENRWFE